MTPAPPPGRARWWLVSASLVLLTLVGVVAWLALRSDEYVATPSKDERIGPQPAAAARALQALESAVQAGDRVAAVALAPRSDPDAAALLGAVIDNASALRVRDFTLRYVDETGGTAEDGAWEAAVDMTWRFAGFDQVSVREEVLVGFAAGHDQDAATITGFGGGDRRSPVWLSGPLQVRRTPQTLVLVAGNAEDADGYAERASRAVPVVQRVLPRWRGGLVLEVPESEEALDRALAADRGTYANIAAVSASVDGTLTPESPVHVFVNPTLFETLEPVGAQVVISHEAAHVATHAPVTTGLPLWLLEGFADYVALRDVPLPITTTAGQIIQQVNRDGPPATLPGSAEFDESATHLGAAYESAWIACTLLAERGGEGALVRLYQRVHAGSGIRPALVNLFGLTEKQLTRLWQARLEDLARRASDAA
jgi:hypothetical protein